MSRKSTQISLDKLDPEVISKIEMGESVPVISRASGIPRSTLYRKISRVRKFIDKKATLSVSDKASMMEDLERGDSVSSICKRFGISRPTFYKWYRRWKEASEGDKHEVLKDQRPNGIDHWRTDHQAYEFILEYISIHSAATLDQIVGSIPKRGDEPMLGRSGVYKFLASRNLNTIEARQNYAYLHRYSEEVPQISPEKGWLNRVKTIFQSFIPSRAPAPPPSFRYFAQTAYSAVSQIGNFGGQVRPS